MRRILNAKSGKSLLAKVLILLMLFSMSMPNLTVFAEADNTVNAYGYNISNKFDGSWSKGNLGPTYQEGEWVAFQTEVIQVDWSNLDNLGVRFDFYDNDAIFYDLVRNISVGTALLPDDHGYPMADGTPYTINSEESANIAQREPEEYIFNGFDKIDVPTHQINRATDLGVGALTDNTRTFYVTKDQILDALGLEEGVDELPNDIVLYFQLHLARTWIWNNTNGDGYALARSYSLSPTDVWGGYIYGDPSFLPAHTTLHGAAAYPGSSGHSYVFINNGDSGEKTIPIPNVSETAGMISGHKYLDSNGNGVFDEGEPPLANWEIFLRTDLYALLDLEFSAMTDEFGYYEFVNLPYNLVWELTETPQAGYVQTHPNGTTIGEGTFTPTPNAETDYWKEPFDVDADPTYAGDIRGPWGWSIKLAPDGHLLQENVDFMNVDNGALLITKQFTTVDDDVIFPEWIQVKVTGPSYPGPDGTIVAIDIDPDTGYGEQLLINLLAGEYTVTEVVLSDGNYERWDPIIEFSPVQVSPGQVDPPAQVNIDNIYNIFSGQIDGNKLDEDYLPLIDPIFEFEIFSALDLATPIAYADSSGILGNFNFGFTPSLIDQDTLTLDEGSYFIKEVNLPPGYEYVKMIMIDGANPPVEYTDELVPFTIVAQDQLINFDVVNKLIPGSLIIEKTFVDGEAYVPELITVHVTGPEGYDETHDLTITAGYGMIQIDDLVPGEYFFEEVTLDANWTVTYDPASQLIVVLPGGTSSAQSVSISNEIVPGSLIIEKFFVDGEAYVPELITVHVTGPEGYDETHDITITAGYGMIQLDGLVPGEYFFEEVTLDANWTVTYDPAS
ncbi:MAG: hypothetical protein JEZ08_08650, partial [Clostridiales bacterium]|nr:hypothetical protein [Clostridiales bacterium]